MSKKIYDIIPPHLNKKEEIIQKKKPSKRSHQKEFFLGVLLFLIIIVAFSFFYLPKADVRIWPKMTTESFKVTIILEGLNSEIDLDKRTIPLLEIKKENEIWIHDIEVTGVITEATKARGKIKIYNEREPFNSLNLVQGTRFLSEEGKYFISENSIHVPAPRMEGGEIIPGVVEINVIASETGEEYNINPSEFSIPGLAGTNLYHTTYGKSDQSMTGGSIGETRYVTKEDIEKAKDRLINNLLSDIEKSLESSFSSDIIVFENTISKDVIEITPIVEAGDRVNQFSIQGKSKATALVLEEKKIRHFAKEYISSRISEKKKIFEERLEMEYVVENIFFEDKKIVLEVDFIVDVYQEPNRKEVFDLIKNKKPEEGKENIYLNLDEVFRVEIFLQPFWVRTIPVDTNKTDISFIIE